MKSVCNIRRFIECLIPVTACNLKCEYCYVIQENRRKNEMPIFKYSPETIAKGLSQKRLGGKCYISICGAGETLLPKETLQIVKLLLDEGHYVNITTNGTITKRFYELENFSKDECSRLHFAFSLHYIELINRNLLGIFASNVNYVKKMGCSFVVQINLCDSYEIFWHEIKQYCISNFGAPPQVAATRMENKKMTLYTKHSFDEYYNIGSEMNSPLFDYTMKYFNMKRKEFCYAGDWSFLLNLSTGIASKCYNQKGDQDIFADISKPIHFEAVGHGCACQYCINSSHFMSLGVIPEVNTPTYAELRDREEAGWYSEEMKNILSSKLVMTNRKYPALRKFYVDYKRKIKYWMRRKFRKEQYNGGI